MKKNERDSQSIFGRMFKKKSMLMISLAMLLSIVAGGTLAYIAVTTNKVTNEFSPAIVSCTVDDNSDKISVTNTSDVDAYIRAAIVVNWVNKETGNIVGSVPTEYTQSLDINNSDQGWNVGSDGFYYYKPVVAPNNETEPLIKSISFTKANPSDYDLLVEVVAEAIQAEGVTSVGNIPAYQNAWFSVSN